MTTICIILARGGSKGLPGKNIHSFAGKPLLAHTIEAAQNSEYIENVFVSSDDAAILDVVKKCGAIGIKRPAELATDTSTSEEALAHAIESAPYASTIVFLQPTSPLRTTRDIDRCIETKELGDYDSVFSAVKAEDVMMWRASEGLLEPISYDSDNRARRQDMKENIIENGSVYVFKRDTLEKYKNRIGGKVGYCLMDKWKVHEIDDIDDLKLCEYLFLTKGGLLND